MVLQKYILPIPFFISLFIGFLMCYVLTPPPQIICRHPTPDNIDTIYQNEEGGGCYKYEVDTVKCPKDKNIVKKTPVDYKCNK